MQTVLPMPSAAPPHLHLDLSRIAQDLQIRKLQVEAVVHLLDEGNTIPFITRYRKERTGGLNEDVLRIIQERVGQLRHLNERKQTILRSIENQGKLTDDLRAAIQAADNPKRLEDLYLPYKAKKRTLATTAREKGLEPLALAIWTSDPAVANLVEVLPNMVNPEKELTTPEAVLEGAQHILAELVAESADVRGVLRAVLWDTGKLCTKKNEKLAEGQGVDFKEYFDFSEPIRHIPPHRILAINRGEKEGALTLKLQWDEETGHRVALERLPLPLPGAAVQLTPTPAGEAAPTPSLEEAPTPAVEAASAPTPAAEAAHSPSPASELAPLAEPAVETAPAAAETPPLPSAAHEPAAPPPRPTHISHRELMARRTEAFRKHPHQDFLKKVAADALARLLVPSLEREIRKELTQRTEAHAVEVFARNLRSKLLAAPLRDRRVLAIDPGFRSGCKLAVLDATGNLLEDGVIFPHPPQNKKHDARLKLEELARKHQAQVIAIGNGTACRETEELVSELMASLEARRLGLPDPLAAAPPPPPVAPPVPQAPPDASPPPEAAAAQVSMPEVIAAPAPPTEPSTPAPTPVETASAPATEGASEPQLPAAAVSVPAAPAPAPPPPPPVAPAVALAHLPEALPELAYVIVNEAGASVYSTSPVGREEFPNNDATLRGTVSIGRRLQDPLSELVKIDPQHVGVGMYQHDLKSGQLKDSLDSVVESCVNQVGVDVNTASVALLRHVSGLNAVVARDLVEYRKTHGLFQHRQQLLDVPGIGEQRFIQAAGFLKVLGDNPLDGTWIHPESYAAARQLLSELGYGPEVLAQKDKLAELREKLKTVSPEEVAARLQLGPPTVRDILDALARPGRDPREDLPPPIFKKGILKLEDLQASMELKGVVLNVVDFGAFVDIGLKDSGLVHISQMANRYVKSPYDVAAVGDVVRVWVLKVEQDRRRVSLTMIQPGTERKPQERKPPERKPQGPPRREGRPPPREDQQGQAPAPARAPLPRPVKREGQAAGQASPPRRDGGPQRREGGPQRRDGGPQRREGGAPRPQARRLPPRGQTAMGHQQKKGPPGQKQPPVPVSAPIPNEGAAPAAGQVAASGGQPAQPQRKAPRRASRPTLTPSALAGETPLNTFGELAAFWAKKEEPPPAEGPEPQAEAAVAAPTAAPTADEGQSPPA